ncbi:LOW QUALITY PROTEIN: NB-ARC domain containing protein [Parasponia andersonii]|uniref:NB-ARC domain containing protein n=1 Tax=Parasponia andersonii TaxID=3476 RepID=A0A2P5B0B7_PARAD|nr:LOW QUALITY PROTEIN: NB-ARC domain containing protein [Parasponia andersonii]
MRMSLVTDELLDGNFNTISYPAPPPGGASVSIQHSEHSAIITQAMIVVQEAGTSSATSNQLVPAPLAFKSRTLMIKYVMDALKGDQINPIVICGMGGIGKTTTLREVNNRAKAESLFNEFAWADITRTLSR